MKKKLAAAAAVMTALFSMTGCATTADGAATGANGATSLIMIVGIFHDLQSAQGHPAGL